MKNWPLGVLAVLAVLGFLFVLARRFPPPSAPGLVAPHPGDPLFPPKEQAVYPGYFLYVWWPKPGETIDQYAEVYSKAYVGSSAGPIEQPALPDDFIIQCGIYDAAQYDIDRTSAVRSGPLVIVPLNLVVRASSQGGEPIFAKEGRLKDVPNGPLAKLVAGKEYVQVVKAAAKDGRLIGREERRFIFHR